nr:Uma2 family endonuclease [[Leptolyngbya] sp. PCC 7376]
MPTAVQTYYSPEEYLELELNSEERHEYIDGEIIPMTGAMPNHNRIVGNFYATLNFALKRKPFDSFVNDQRLWIPAKNIYTYPDIMVVKGDLVFQMGRKDTITNPIMIVEVLSKSTESYDRGAKFQAYRSIPTFQEYVLIEQYSMQVERYYKTDNDEWLFTAYETAEDLLVLKTVPCEILLEDLYEKVDFTED